MSLINLPVDELFANRPRQILDMLSPLDSIKPLHCDAFKYQVAGGKALIAHDGISQKESHREYPFRLRNTKLDCTYYEIWIPVEDYQTWGLYQAYFTIFEINNINRKSEELICIHSDPAEKPSEPVYRYKIGPHLHVEKSDYPLKRCHFPLCIANLDQVLSSITEFSTALKSIIKMTHDEIVRLYTK